MIQKNRKLINLLNALSDGVLIFISYILASGIRFGLLDGAGGLTAVWNWQYFRAAACYAVFMVLAYYFTHLYGSYRFKTIWEEASTVLGLNLLGVLTVTGVLYITRWADFSRLAIGLVYVFSTVLILGKRAVVRRVRQRGGYNQKHVLVLGSGPLARRFAQDVQQAPGSGMQVDGYVAAEEQPGLGSYLGSWDKLDEALAATAYDEVVAALEPEEMQRMPQVIQAIERSGTKFSIIPFFNDYIPARPTIDVLGETKLINVRTIPLDNMGWAMVKRTMDVAGSLILILLSSPIMLVTALGVKLSSPGPILFRQERVGRNKKVFTMYKFRSMRVNAAQDTAWSKDQDPRKTKFGSFIRKTSLDELPQFFNVLKGDMSLIGPRPEIPFYVDQFKDTIPLYMVRHQVRPGITGWAQVCGYRGDTSIEERIKHDIYYIENWSLLFDLRILFKTAFGGMINSEKVGKQDTKSK